ncbi:MAG: PQQ-dependent sugar dehydrogenase [Chloroflexota bacterium]
MPVIRLALGFLMLTAAACASPVPTSSPPPTTETIEGYDAEETTGAKPGSAPTATPRPQPTTTVRELRSELVTGGLILPQALAFSPDGRIFFVEVKKGAVRVLANGLVQERPVATIGISRGAEHGLIGLALDPGFATNHHLYTYYTQPETGNTAGRPRRHRLTRWTEHDGVADSEVPVLDNLPTGKCCHTGGKMAFADDGSMVVALGDQGDADRRDAQHPNRVNGKILRFDVQRAIQEKPDPRSFIYASGLRNPYGLDIHPVTGDIWLTDNGPDMCDELNIVRPGANFGNPTVECTANDERFDDPAWDSGVDRLGLTGARIYHGSMFPEYVGDALFCSINTGHLLRAVLSRPDFKRVERIEQIVSGQDGQGCRLDLAVAPDGSIFYTSVTSIFRLSR